MYGLMGRIDAQSHERDMKGMFTGSVIDKLTSAMFEVRV